MKKDMHDACQMIDASVFSSDFLCDAGEREELKGYAESWMRAIKEHEDMLPDCQCGFEAGDVAYTGGLSGHWEIRCTKSTCPIVCQSDTREGVVELWRQMQSSGINEKQAPEGCRPILAGEGCLGCMFRTEAECGEDRPCCGDDRSDNKNVIFIPKDVLEPAFMVKGDHPVAARQDKVFRGDDALARAIPYYLEIEEAGYENVTVDLVLPPERDEDESLTMRHNKTPLEEIRKMWSEMTGNRHARQEVL